MRKSNILKKQYGTTFKILTMFALLLIDINASFGCTVFVLTDKKNTYLFNNEDFTNPKTRIWFVPKGKGFYGSAYVGFDDGEAQGGFNTQGLAFEWVTVEMDSYETDPNYIPKKNLIQLEVNTSQWMLERCKTVEEAIKFYQKFREPAFAKSTLVVVDKSGASVIIGSKNGEIYFDTSRKSRSFGFGESKFQKLYNPETPVGKNDGGNILKACVVSGDGGTKYSNAYNLKTGEIIFYNFLNETENTSINLFEELKKGSHYYETSKVFNQSKQALKPLMLNMNRHILSIHQPLANQEPEFTVKIKNMFSEVSEGKLHYDDLSESFTADLRKSEQTIKTIYGKFGHLKTIDLIHKKQGPDCLDYSYVMKFDNVSILWQFLVDDKSKIFDFNTLSVMWKP